MPIFEYRCEGCGTAFEQLVRGSTTAVLCPKCGHDGVEKQLSTFAARSGSKETRPMSGGCPSGMCQNPDICGRN